MYKFAADSVVSCDGITMEVEEFFPDGMVVVSRYLMTTGVRYSRMEFPGDSHYDNSIIDHDDSLDDYIDEKLADMYDEVDDADTEFAKPIEDRRCIYHINPSCMCKACIALDDIYPRD